MALDWATLLVGALLGCSRSEVAPLVAGASPSLPSCAERLRIELEHPGASSAEVEAMDAIPVEAAINGLATVEHVDSTAMDGRAIVWVTVSSDAMQASEPIREALDGVAAMLPTEAMHPVLSIARVPRSWLVVLVRGPAEPLTAVADALEHTIATSRGTHRVRRQGRATAVLSIEPDPSRLSALGLDASTLATAVEQALHPVDARMLVRTAPTVTLEDLGNVELATREGVPLRLRDVATLRHERTHEGSQAWAGGSEAELWVVETDDADAIRRAVDAVAAPPEISVSVTGELVPRGCPSPAGSPVLAGEFEQLEFALPAGSEPSQAATLVGRAPVADDAVWWTMDPLLDDAEPPDPTRVHLLIPKSSPHRAELLAWVEQTAGLELHGHYGPGRTHVVLALRHPELERLRDGTTWVIEAARARGMHATSETTWLPRLELEIDRDAAARLGVSVGDVAEQVRAAQQAREVGVIDDGGKPLPVRIVPFRAEGRALAQDPVGQLAAIRVPTPSGTSVSLSSLARIESTTQPSRIERSDRSRVRYVRIWIEAEQLGSTEAAMVEIMEALRGVHPDVDVRRVP